MPEKNLDFLDGRGIIRFLEDEIKFYCTMQQSFGHEDENINKEILYISVPNLPLEPENLIEVLGHYDHFKRFSIHVPKIGKTIVFFVTQKYDTDVHPNYDESLYGPYLAKKENG